MSPIHTFLAVTQRDMDGIAFLNKADGAAGSSLRADVANGSAAGSAGEAAIGDEGRENPRYTMMTPEEVLGKFVSGRMMIKEARYVDDALNGPLHEPQPIALKATRSKESLPSKVAQVEAAGLNDEEMALIIKRFKTVLKGHKGQPSKNKTKGK